ncbi:MAG TPA: sigma-70 family RNA polymerase sigma factor, partial [Gemmataceae bacterium]|nr:sigma-70 family RNA polymerase sigma factor [Gemmataceae bacterium]
MMRSPEEPAGARQFPSTHWSVILQARDQASPRADEALAELCRTYWYPLYAYIRHRTGSADQAQDLTQEFFARLLEKSFLGAVDPDRGRFRAFLLACCRHFLSNERDRERAQKRGGGQPLLSLDFTSAEERYRCEPAHDVTAERLFERRWALTLLEQTLGQLETEYRRDGKERLYELLHGTLIGEESLGYTQVGEELGLSEAAVKKAAQRLRQRYREILRERICATVDDPAHADDEIR